jgi:hypothetical protein
MKAKRPDNLGEDYPYQRWAHYWDEIRGSHNLGAKEGLLLEEISEVIRLIDELGASLDNVDVVVDGKPSPIVVELRQQRALLSRLIAQLPPQEPDNDGQSAPLTPSQERARKAARARWDQPGARRRDWK